MKIFLLLYRFFQKRRFLLAVFVLATVALFTIPVSKLRLEEDISQFLPKTDGIEKINRAMQNMKVQDKMAINIHLTDTSKIDELLLTEMADLFADSIAHHFDSTFIAECKFKRSEESFSDIYAFYNQHLPVFFEEQNYARLTSIIHPDSIDKIVKAHYQNLISPTGMVTGKFIGIDPLNLTSTNIKKLQGLQLDENIEIYEGYFLSKDHKNLLAFLSPAFKSSDNQKSELLINYLEVIRKAISNISKGKAELEYYGGPAVAVSNSACIKEDTKYSGIISIILIALILLFYFRSARSMIILLLPVAFGVLFSLCIISLFSGTISVIALGAGSIVFGIGINYSLHILTHYKHYGHVEVVLKDLFQPMFLGCLTTVSAFFSLLFLKSEALNDFGLFAGLSLTGTLLFSFIIMPHLFSKKNKTEHRNNLLDKLSEWQPHKNKWMVGIVILGSLFLAFFSHDVRFEKDMRNLSYESPQLKQAKDNLDQINNYTQQTVFVSVTAGSREEALKQNERIAERIHTLKDHHPKIQFSSLAGIILSQEEQSKRLALWDKFWTPEKIGLLKSYFNASGSKYGFAPDAFDPFFELLNQKQNILSKGEQNSFSELMGTGMMNEASGETTVYSIMKADQVAKQELYDLWAGDKNITVFDNARITTLFTEAVANDFQVILLITALMVFGFMLLSHGRIETTIINFLPMLVSWLCILGIMALCGITFNLINIVISTFVFGLGDDYSIFILDGLSTEYKYGRKLIGSYKSSILLSAIITMAGIGILLFAKHPALKSVAFIGVLGIVVVIIVSFVIQPLIYNWLILNRSKKGLPPYTALNLLITIVGFLVFMFGSLFLTLFGFLLFYVLPVNKDRKKLWFHISLMRVNQLLLAFFVNVKKTIIHTEKSEFEKPAIIIANHQSHIDLALIMQLHPKIIFFTNDWVWNSPFYGKIVQMADFYPASRGYENAAVQLKPMIDKGYSLMIFPEGTRSVDGHIHRFHKGAFYLQEQLGLDILPVLIHGAGDCVTKGDFHFKRGRLTVKVLPRIAAANTKPGLTYKERSKWVSEYMRHEFKALKTELENGSYYRSRLMANYIYKGPVMEWYARIKTRMENNYEWFDSILPKSGLITDVGCGYGYLSYMLAYTGPARQITGMDYDEEKIQIANNNFSARNQAVKFVHADLMNFDMEPSDGIAVLDVLHYLAPEEQVICIHKFLDKLNKGGTLIIRDADHDMKRKHAFTKYTEFFSTNSGFNKTNSKGLSFVSSKLIENTILERGGFSCEIIDNTRYLSNLVYVVRHKEK